MRDISDDSISIAEKYDSAFFEKNSLVIVAFRTRSGGGEIEKIKAFRRGSKLIVEISGSTGIQSVISGQAAVLEVKKNAISGVNKIQFTTNMDKF